MGKNIALQILYIFVLRAEIATIFGSKMVAVSVRNTNIYIYNLETSQGYIVHTLQHFATKFCNFTILKLVYNANENCPLGLAN